MSEQFKEQGGASTMDPGPFKRWLVSQVMTRSFSPERVAKRRAAAERQRQREQAPHRVEYFHQLDDGYSHLAAQVLPQLSARYDIELVCHLVEPPRGNNVPEPEMLQQLSRFDAQHIAAEYGLQFPGDAQAPDPALVQQAAAVLAAQPAAGFVACAADVGQALWTGDKAALDALAAEHGRADEAQLAARIAAGTERRKALKHYSGAMFYYAGEWYWGVDRLYHLEQRLAALGADRQSGHPPQDQPGHPSQQSEQSGHPLIAPRPALDAKQCRDDGSLTLEVFASLRSPYTAIVFDRAVALARDTGVTLAVRPVLPMVMRGAPVTREKGMYIFMDTAREALAAGVPYGNFYDPIGEPVRRCYSLYPWAVEQGRGVELLSSFLRHAFAEGVNTNTTKGLRKVVEAAGLDWAEAQQHLGDPAWEPMLEANRLAMYGAGLWGVPSFRLLDETGEPVLALWGQDRLWRIAREIQRLRPA